TGTSGRSTVCAFRAQRRYRGRDLPATGRPSPLHRVGGRAHRSPCTRGTLEPHEPAAVGVSPWTERWAVTATHHPRCRPSVGSPARTGGAEPIPLPLRLRRRLDAGRRGSCL